MHRHAKALVSALLPILPLALCAGCGGAGSAEAVQAEPPMAPVTLVNQAPTINGVGDGYAKVGEPYSFQPAARDADGDVLRFAANNLPPWASIDATNGRVSGTPGPGDPGVYEAITISVADGSRQSMTAPFSITVIEGIATGVASLSWEVPPSKLDGSPLDDLAGYRIRYGRNSDDLDKSVFIGDPAVTFYEFSSLPSGIWYFAVVAVNAGGLEGPPTTTTMKSI
jgi:hypothetical protein